MKIGDKTATYTVMAVPEPEGVSPIVYGVALVVIAAAAYFYMQSQKEA